MADIKYNPEELEQQSNELTAIRTDFESLFQETTKAMKGIDDSWSENLSKNFSGKIQTAQNSFSGIVSMLGNGAAAAKLGSTSESSTAVEKCLSMSSVNDTAGTVNSYVESAENWASENADGIGKDVENITGSSTAGAVTSGIIKVWDKLEDYNDDANEHMSEAVKDLVSGDFSSAAKNAGQAMGDFGKYLFTGTVSIAKETAKAVGGTVISGFRALFS